MTACVLVAGCAAATPSAGGPTTGPGATSGPGVTPGTGATSGAGTSAGATAGPGATSGAGGGTAKAGTANLTVSGDLQGSWTLDKGSGDVSPTATLIAGVWVEAISNTAGGYADIINLTVGGPITSGATSKAGIIVSFTISRTDSTGKDLFLHTFNSLSGECQVTMARVGASVTGSFTCASIRSEDGKTVQATGNFAT
jgi:hypothetical protein